MLVTADAEFNQTFIMFLMKTQLLVCLLGVFLSVGAAEDVQEERAELSIPGVSLEETPDVQTPQERSAVSCPPGWQQYQNKCYQLLSMAYAWNNAEFHCESIGSNLVSVRNFEEYSFLQNMARSANYPTAWIGGYRFQGYWKWDDGTPFLYDNWYSHSSSSRYECLYLNSEGVLGWANQECHLGKPFICAKNLC
ncbi:galactose-specific lectin nattectin-like [Antennarius striatus]|uniref:galactose-specific lectin nattectin-like n=1 Tax=Antennarius striatus TaxID=241820 RepID=UPI0035B4B9B5